MSNLHLSVPKKSNITQDELLEFFLEASEAKLPSSAWYDAFQFFYQEFKLEYADTEIPITLKQFIDSLTIITVPKMGELVEKLKKTWQQNQE